MRTARKEGFLAVRGNHDNFILAAATGVGRFSDALTLEERLKSPPWVQELSRFVIELRHLGIFIHIAVFSCL